MRRLKSYKKFLESKSYNNRFKFEDEVIDPILILIRDNQEYLTQRENLPQLAKLGFIYNTLWYDGRICWGYDGILLDKKLKKDIDGDDNIYQYTSCEDNPKYKIEMCDPINDDIENLIYDAWGMHISRDDEKLSFDEFIKIIKEGKELTELEKKELKVNKTFDEWVEIKTDPNYRYKSLYPNRKSVASHLLCTIGNGYGWNKDGFIIEEASGADQDKALYGDWMNAKFSTEIEAEVYRVLNIPEVKLTVDTVKDYFDENNRKKKEKEKISNSDIIDVLRDTFKDKPELLSKISDDMDISEIVDIISEFKGRPRRTPNGEKYVQYYPISRSSDIYALGDAETQKRIGIEKFDQSYIDAAKEICEDILNHKEQERKENVEFAIKFMAYHGYEEYQKMMPKEIDKYELLEEIKAYFYDMTDSKSEITTQLSTRDYNSSSYCIRLDDSAKSSYGSNNYYINILYTKEEAASLPKGESNNIDFLKETSIYDSLSEAMSRLDSNENVKFVTFHYENGSHCEIAIVVYVNEKYVQYAKEEHQTEENFKSQGFEVGKNSIYLKLDKIGVTLSIRKPKPLGSSHPNNKSGKEYFSNALQMDVSDGARVLFSLQIDERKYNTCRQSGQTSPLSEWMVEEFYKMKASNPDYGNYGIDGARSGSEGKKSLYAHDFMLWLKNNQDNFSE